MANIIFRTFDPDADPTYKKTWTDRAIQIKSRLTHTTKQYSERYGGLSCSATMKGGYNCVRFRPNNYLKHPLRWESIAVPCTDEQEDIMWAEDCRMADIYMDTNTVLDLFKEEYRIGDLCYAGPNAIKYDKFGVVLCNISHRRIIKSWNNRVWCTEQCIMALLKAFPDLTDKHPDEFRPDNGHKLVKEYFS